MNVPDLGCRDGSEAGASTTCEVARHFNGVWGTAQVRVDPISALKTPYTQTFTTQALHRLHKYNCCYHNKK